MEKGNAVKNLIKKNQLMITALAIMIAIAGYLQFAGTNLEKEYLAADDADTLSAVDSTDIVTDKIIWMKICRWQRLRRTKGRFPGKQC